MFAYLSSHKINWSARNFSRLGAKQRGAILILVLLIVALVAGLAIKFAGEYQLGLARAETRWFGTQMRAYFLSVEAIVTEYMKSDMIDRDDRSEPWAQKEATVYPVDGGTIEAQVTDASAQIDLNSLLKNNLDPNKSFTDPQKFDQPQRMFIRLLQEFPDSVRSTDEAVTILQSVIYWASIVDPTTVGEDDQYYASQPVPYRASHAYSYRSVEELQLVRGVSPELMAALRPFVTVIGNGQIKMNINTLPLELVRTINLKADLLPLDMTRAQSLYEELGTKPVKQIAELDSLMQGQFGQATEVDRDFVNKTDYFWLKMRLNMGDQFRTQKSLMLRGTNGAPFTVIRREEIF